MPDALIGYTGFVGGTLLRQRGFEGRFRSTNVAELAGADFDLVVCAGAPAQKWLANKEPEADRARLEPLLQALDALTCRRFVLISTVDVFARPVEVDEGTPVEEAGLHAYGLHRRMLEKHVAGRFERALIVRLPGLVGPGLKKNAVYDLHHGNNLQALDSRAVFQLYPMVNLWADLSAALARGLTLLHLTAEPLSLCDIAREGFGRTFVNELAGVPARYDFRSRHAAELGRGGHWQYDRRDTIQAIRAYAQSEPRAAPAGGAKGT